MNGGAEVTSATVQNGDSVAFLMDAPATGNANNKMTITGGAVTLSIWRVWTGDTTGTIVKRVFITSTTYDGNLGGVLGADAKCQTRAGAAALGGTWKAIISGALEQEWAINRIGYNWWKLTLVDGTDVVIAPNLWSASPALLSPIVKTETGAVFTGAGAFSNTTVLGQAKYATASGGNCQVWSSGGYSGDYGNIGYSSGSDASWISYQDAYAGCNGSYQKTLYCIEQ